MCDNAKIRVFYFEFSEYSTFFIGNVEKTFVSVNINQTLYKYIIHFLLIKKGRLACAKNFPKWLQLKRG